MRNFSLCKDLDPDVHFYSQAINCEYFSEGSFNKMLADCSNHFNSNHLNLNNNCANLALLHLNIRSISKKLTPPWPIIFPQLQFLTVLFCLAIS